MPGVGLILRIEAIMAALGTLGGELAGAMLGVV
jgi:hypothetical protein